MSAGDATRSSRFSARQSVPDLGALAQLRPRRSVIDDGATTMRRYDQDSYRTEALVRLRDGMATGADRATSWWSPLRQGRGL